MTPLALNFNRIYQIASWPFRLLVIFNVLFFLIFSSLLPQGEKVTVGGLAFLYYGEMFYGLLLAVNILVLMLLVYRMYRGVPQELADKKPNRKIVLLDILLLLGGAFPIGMNLLLMAIITVILFLSIFS